MSAVCWRLVFTPTAPTWLDGAVKQSLEKMIILASRRGDVSLSNQVDGWDEAPCLSSLTSSAVPKSYHVAFTSSHTTNPHPAY